MPEYAISIDDGLYVAYAQSSTYADMVTAVRSTIRTAMLIAIDDPGDMIRATPIECEVQDRESREIRRFSVAIVTRGLEDDANRISVF